MVSSQKSGLFHSIQDFSIFPCKMFYAFPHKPLSKAMKVAIFQVLPGQHTEEPVRKLIKLCV